MTTEKKKTIPSISIESQEIIKILLTAEVGDVFTYEQLSEVCLGDVRKEKYFALDTARKTMLRDYYRVFQTVKKVGIKRANDIEIIEEAGVAIAQVHKTIGRKLKKLEAVSEYEKLPKQKKVEYNARTSQLGALYLITKASKSKQIESATAKNGEKLALKETMDMFAK